MIRVAQDTAPVFEFHIRRDFAPVSLDGCNVDFIITKPDTSTVTKIVSVTDAALGYATCSLDSTDTTQTGTYYGDVKVTFADSSIQHGRRAVQFRVRAEGAV